MVWLIRMISVFNQHGAYRDMGHLKYIIPAYEEETQDSHDIVKHRY
jgi:hypothetical protein